MLRKGWHRVQFVIGIRELVFDLLDPLFVRVWLHIVYFENCLHNTATVVCVCVGVRARARDLAQSTSCRTHINAKRKYSMALYKHKQHLLTFIIKSCFIIVIMYY